MPQTMRTTLPDELYRFVLEWKDKPGNLIMILHRTQQHYGYIPEPIADEISRIAGIPTAKIYGVVTFYNFFNLAPPGKHRVAVCMGTACYLKGAEAVTEQLTGTLGVQVNEVTSDRMFSLLEVRCVGCCGLAPAIMIDDDLHGKMNDAEQLHAVLRRYQEAG